MRATDVALYHSMGEWEMRPSDLRLLERIAVGGFAEVFRATWKGTMVAVKQLLERGPDVVAGFARRRSCSRGCGILICSSSWDGARSRR